MAKEIRDEYVDTMSKIYYSYFKSYSSRLLKVQVSVNEAWCRSQVFEWRLTWRLLLSTRRWRTKTT